jgi:RimJ/RimL family protein N-acetyltransferase
MTLNSVELDHLNLTVANFKETAAWYERVFGFQVIEEGMEPDGPWGVLRSGDIMLCIYESPHRSMIHLKDGTEVTVRSARTDDAAAIMEMVSGVFKSSPYLLTEPDEFTVTLEQEKGWVEGFLPSPNSVLLVAEIDGRLVGILDFKGGHRRRIAHSGMIGTSVREAYRGRSVGSVLMDALIEWAKGTGTVEKLELLVFADNEHAMALYKKMGFQEEGRKHKAIRLSDGRYLDELLMARFV